MIKDYKIIYYRDNGSVPPEYHTELIVKIKDNGIIKIKKLKGYEDQILFSCLTILKQEDKRFIEDFIYEINQKNIEIIKKEMIPKFGAPLEYIEILISNSTIKWFYDDNHIYSKETNEKFLSLYKKIQTILEQFPL